jgi:hypothetical protein
MKLKTIKSHTVEVTFAEIIDFYSRLVEKKTGKKITNVDGDEVRGKVFTFTLSNDSEETNLDEVSK